jgi:hypothetical protein
MINQSKLNSLLNRLEAVTGEKFTASPVEMLPDTLSIIGIGICVYVSSGLVNDTHAHTTIVDNVYGKWVIKNETKTM